MRRRVIRAAGAVAVLTVMAACGGDDGGGDSVSVVGVEAVGFDGPIAYEVSPDGRYVAARVDGQLCIAEVDAIEGGTFDAESSLACDPEPDGAGAIGQFSPDSQRIVYGPDFLRLLEAGEIRVVGVDGSVTTVAEPPESDGDSLVPTGSITQPLFADDDTVAFGRTVGDPPTVEVVTVGADGSGESVVGGIDRVSDEGPWLPLWDWSVRGDELLVAMSDLDRDVFLWTIDLDDGETTEIPVPRVSGDRRSSGWQLHDKVGSVVLIADLEVLRIAPGDEPGWWIADVDGDDGAIPIDVSAVNEGLIAAATLSPNGATVAVYVIDLVASDGAAGVQVLTAPIGDVLAGTATWASVELPEDATPAADLGRSFRSLSWRDADSLVFKSRDAVYRFELE